jgi:hypothetical protein
LYHWKSSFVDLNFGVPQPLVHLLLLLIQQIGRG